MSLSEEIAARNRHCCRTWQLRKAWGKAYPDPWPAVARELFRRWHAEQLEYALRWLFKLRAGRLQFLKSKRMFKP